MSDASSPLLRVTDLRAHFVTEDAVVRAVDGVSFELRRGEVVGIVGESGSGKSAMSLALMGLLPQPETQVSGEVMFEGRSLLGLSDAEWCTVRGKRIAMIFQDPMTSLNPYLTVERQLTEVVEAHENVSKSDARARSAAMLARVGIADPVMRMACYPHELSGGMRQRVVIAMALLCKPDLLLADEPTTALDVTIQAQILELIAELQREMGSSVVLITHDLGVVASMTTTTVVMYAGRIVESGRTADVFARPSHPYTRGLLRSIPRLDRPVDEALTPIAGRPPDLSALPTGCPFRPRCGVAVARCGEAYPDRVSIGADHVASCWQVKS